MRNYRLDGVLPYKVGEVITPKPALSNSDSRILGRYSMRLYVVLAGILLLGLSALTSNAQELSLDQIEKRIDSMFLQYEHEPGIAIGIVKDGEIVYQKGIGLANLDYDIPVSPSTMFDVGAVAMQVTAACIVLLENEQKLSFDDPVSKFLPELPAYQEGEVTIYHLLHHSSGIRDYLIALSMSGKPWDEEFTNQMAFDIIKKQTSLGITPGQEYEYSNSNYLLLGLIVERVSGLSLAQFAEKNIFEPLGMKNTFYYDNSSKVVKNRAIAYQKAEDQYQMEHIFQNTVCGDGRLYTNVEDFIKWMTNLDNSVIGNREFVATLTERGVRNDGEQMSYAKAVDHGYERGAHFYGHNGYWGGFSAMMLKFPDNDLSVFTVTNNTEISSPGVTYQIAGYFLPDNSQRIDAEGFKMSRKTVKQFCGDYITYKTGYLRKVFLSGDTLKYQVAPGTVRVLKPIAKNTFRITGIDVDYTIEFIEADKSMNMRIRREGLIHGDYSTYVPIADSYVIPQEVTGKYYSDELDAEYELEIVDNKIVVSVNGEELMKYETVKEGFYCSESTHHGYLVFDKDDYSGFELNDYSLKKVLFKRHAL
ncbi:MAG: serine hydrolase domain-containing protein [Bacteroidota bacterium]